MGSMGAFFGGLASGINQQLLYRQQKEDQAEAFTDQLKQSEESQIRVSKATGKPAATFTHPLTGVIYTGMNAQAAKEIYVKDEINRLGLSGDDDDAHMMPIGNSGMFVNTRKITGQKHTPGYASSMLAQIDQNAPVYERAGVNFNALAMVPTIRNLISQITTQQKEDPQDPDSQVYFGTVDINKYKNLARLAKTMPELAEVFEKGIIPNQILTDPNRFEVTTDTINGQQVSVYTPTGWKEHTGGAPDPNTSEVKTWLTWNNISGNINNIDTGSEFLVKFHYDPIKEGEKYGMGVPMMAIYQAKTNQERGESSNLLLDMADQEYFNGNLNPSPEQQKQFIRDFSSAAFAMVPNKIFNQHPDGRVFVNLNPYKDFVLQPALVKQAYERSQLGFELVNDLSTMRDLLKRAEASTSYKLAAQSGLDRLLDPQSGLVAAGKTIVERFANEFKRVVKRSDFSDGNAAVKENYGETIAGDFLNGLVAETLNDSELEDALNAKKAELAGPSTIFGDRKLITKRQQEVIDRTHKKLLMAKMTYQFAAMFQGGAGGRMISDQDFKIVFTALFRAPNTVAQESALNMLQSKLELGLFENHVRSTYGSSGKSKKIIDKYQVIFDQKYRRALENYDKAASNIGDPDLLEKGLQAEARDLEENWSNSSRKYISNGNGSSNANTGLRPTIGSNKD